MKGCGDRSSGGDVRGWVGVGVGEMCVGGVGWGGGGRESWGLGQ